ncbi:hypothetical protein AN958_05895 [Leucoagaricus sp. SymC.cos]|nr:hypothetical protein AN958_05895 [Leucoagaricus sp. SymC.cos]
MPEYPEYLWGATASHVTRSEGGRRVHFEEINEPATNPTVSRMRIATGSLSDQSTHWLEVLRREAPFVTIADVQRAVIGWMKQVKSTIHKQGVGSEAGPELSSWIRLTDDDGDEIEVEVWTWRGLEPLDGSIESWQLKYSEDAFKA